MIVDRASRTKRTENTWPIQGTDSNLVWLGPKKVGVEGLMLLDKEAELLHEGRTVGKAEAPLSPFVCFTAFCAFTDTTCNRGFPPGV